MNYKKIIKNQKLRFAILNVLQFLPDKLMLALQYYIKQDKKCDFKNPQTWTEKLQLYKLYYRNPLLGICVDKHKVRSYVESKGLSDILVKQYGLYDNASEIKWEKLPKSFVLKTSNGGGGLNVMLIRDKNNINLKTLTETFNQWTGSFKTNNVSSGREWAYTLINKSRIICEELLINEKNPEAGIEDFKILCFHGIPKYVIVDKDRYIDHKRNTYDIHWNRIDVTSDHEQFDTPYTKPKNFDKMLRVAEMLSADFPFVRVDLYNLDGQVFFGELTFYPWSGYVKFNPQSFDELLGEMFDISSFLPKKK